MGAKPIAAGKVAFVTYKKLPALTPDDQLAASALRKKGIDVQAAVWDDKRVAWDRFGAVVLRSCWDYHLRPDEFLAWLDKLDGLGVRVMNSTEIVRWNMDKLYLSDLEETGIPVTPTVWLPKGSKAALAEILQAKDWQKVVVKPTVSASAHQTWTATPANAIDAQAKFAEMLSQSGVIVQQYMDAINGNGEWSLMFFGNEYSHAVLKKPGEGDFRVQNEFGGSWQAAQPPGGLIAQAANILATVGETVYARVDGVEEDGRLVLMELELIEPVLFLGDSDGAARRFAGAILEML